MGRIATAFICALIALGAATGAPHMVAAGEGIDIVGPGESGRGVWSGDRMLGARDRLKDILPGRFE